MPASTMRAFGACFRILSSVAREVTVATAGGKTITARVEPPHRDLLAPAADKSTMVMARSLDLRGEGITGTRREVSGVWL